MKNATPTGPRLQMAATQWQVTVAGEKFSFVGLISLDTYTNVLSVYAEGKPVKVLPINGRPDFTGALAVMSSQQVSA